MTQDWTARIAGLRMELDGEFTDRVQQSDLTSQQWSLVMTATNFEIDNPESPEEATLVANTDNLSAVAGEMKRIERDGFGKNPQGGEGKSLFRRIADKFGRDASMSVDFDEANDLADEYASRLQDKLVERGRWDEACAAAASE